VKTFGQSGTRTLLNELRAFARRLGHPGVHFHVVIQEAGMKQILGDLAALGVDSYGMYNAIARAVGQRPPEEDLVEYGVAAADVVARIWPEVDGLQPLPCFPSVSPGADDTPRHLMRPRPPQPNRRQWPGTVVAVNETPAAFEALVRAALAYLNQRPGIPPVLTIGCWNEWTEGHYLLPDTRLGFGMARALARALGRGQC